VRAGPHAKVCEYLDVRLVYDSPFSSLELHGTAANIILIVAGLHAGEALVHHFLLRDHVLRRMLPSRRAQGGAALKG
jgi:cytochrome b561